MSHLFSPFKLGSLQLENRIVISPMCQYSAEQGKTTPWHLIHLGHLALSGAALMFLEAAAVEAHGRITYGDLGLWDDVTEAALAATLADVRRYSAMPIGIQLAHAGRKASSAKPWEGGLAIAADAVNGWPTIGASALPFHEGDAPPAAASIEDIASITAAFAEAARRAERLGLDAIEVHAAHGYLLHQFLSPLSNQRGDRYGGTLENRMRLTLEVFDAVRAAFPAGKPVGVRISASDWVEGGWDLEQSLVLAQALQARGCSFIDVSSGGLSTRQQIPTLPGYQVPFAEAIKKAVAMPVIAVGLITEAQQAEDILAEGRADLVALARGMLNDPRWPWHAAHALGETSSVKVTPQYLRSIR
ncbi:MAG: NADH:flavin oxidoreductase/NADH oxidase [Janthinobacterium lividum]